MQPFVLERYFAKHEFTAPYLMCSSDVEAVKLKELLALADEEGREWWENFALGYTDYPGDARLRDEIAKLYEGVSREQIYCFAGAQEAIYLTFRAILAPGDHVIATWPGYQSLYEVARGCGAEVSLLELKPEDNWELNLSTLESLIKSNTRLVAINFPHNPTGAAISTETLTKLAGLCEANNIWLFSDEVYRGLQEDQPKSAVEISQIAISLGVMSKSFGLAGLRIGWIACRERELLQKIAELKDYTSICNAAPSEALAFIGLRSKEHLWARARKIVRANTELFQQCVDRHPDLLKLEPTALAATMAFPKLNADVQQFADDLRAQIGVLVLPDSVYGYHQNRFRVGLGRQNFPQVLELFEAFLKQK